MFEIIYMFSVVFVNYNNKSSFSFISVLLYFFEGKQG